MASLPSISLLLLLLLLTLFSSQTHLTLSLLDPSLDHRRPSLPLLHSIADVHDLLTLYGLPKGLLPGNIESYTLQNDTGYFSIHLTDACYVDFNPLVYYGKKITGRLSYGAVTDISGIQAKKLFIWVSVTGMEKVKDSDFIEFFVGSLSEKFPTDKFKQVPLCKSKASMRTNIDSM
ncbi:hypothetical protein EZV62_001666 [Acer yangbiense]|uniref:DUF538 domain-containing protein n=1 Tax=Acer yangbiense TaxID=1000413 RepID=A0A5C7IUR6_9ROSI|nr:hypothetical protein EZV62_001666 [Acer yangbiense]